MRELKISDAELQALIAPALRAKLKSVGFHSGASSAECCAVMFPINLDLAGTVDIERGEDGVWIFRQELDAELSSRTAFAMSAHAAAVTSNRGA